MITICTLLCDRKSYSQLIALQAISRMKGEFRVYINLERPSVESGGDYAEFQNRFEPLYKFLASEPFNFDVDIWQCKSTWKKQPAYDQDQARLGNIVTARNMARDYAMNTGASHLLFVDSDVVPRPDALDRLLAVDHSLVGGLVPGRGCHSHVNYVFGNKGKVEGKPGVIACNHGTMGLCLIRRDLFSTLAFRYGPSRTNPKVGLSEDPAFAEDAKLNGFGDFYLDTQTIAGHRDDPENPLRPDTVAQDGGIPL